MLLPHVQASFGKRIQRSDEPIKPDRRTGARNQGYAGEDETVDELVKVLQKLMR